MEVKGAKGFKWLSTNSDTRSFGWSLLETMELPWRVTLLVEFRDCAIIIRSWAWLRVILHGAPPVNKGKLAQTSFLVIFKIMVTSPLNLNLTEFALLYCNVFRRLRLEQHFKTTFDRADFTTVLLCFVFWIVLWITGLKLWVICNCLTTFDFWLSHDQHEHNPERELLVHLSLHWLVNGAALVTVFFPSANWLGARPYCKGSQENFRYSKW